MSQKPRPRRATSSESKDGEPINPTMFDGLMMFAATAGNQQETDEPDLEYPQPEEGPRFREDQ